jgi:type II secretory pathway component PulM
MKISHVALAYAASSAAVVVTGLAAHAVGVRPNDRPIVLGVIGAAVTIATTYYVLRALQS